MGWVKCPAESHLDALGTAGGNRCPRARREGAASPCAHGTAPARHGLPPRDKMWGTGLSSGFSSVLHVRRVTKRDLRKGGVLQVVQDFPMTCAG